MKQLIKLKMQKRLSMMKVRNKHPKIKKLFMIFSSIVLIGLSVLAINKYQLEQDSADIGGLALTYYQAINNREYSLLEKIYTPQYPWRNQSYIEDIKAKMDVVGMKQIRVDKVYPAMVNGDIGIVGIVSTETTINNGKEHSFQELNVLFAKYDEGKWHIAKPEDISQYDESLIEGMFEKYKKEFKDDITIRQIVKNQKAYFDSMQQK